MKRISIFFGLAVILVAAVLTLGCGSQTPPASDQVTTEQAAAAEPTPEATQSRAAQDSIKEARAREDHQNRVATYREAFATNDTWHEQLGSSPYPFAQACAMMLRADGMKFSIDMVKGGQITWSELGLTEVQAEEKLKATAKTAAQSLFKGWKQPSAIRAQARTCDQGEGQYEWTESLRLLRDIKRVLDLGQLSPADIGTSPAELRSMLIADLKIELEQARQGGSDKLGWFLHTFNDAQDEYNILPVEIGLKPEELSELSPG